MHRSWVLRPLAALAGFSVALWTGAAIAAGGGVTQVSTGTGYEQSPVLAADPLGDLTAAWTDNAPKTPSRFSVVTASFSSATGAWGAPQTISDVNVGPAAPVVTMAASGAAAIAWTESVSRPNKATVVTNIEAVTRPDPTAPWTTPVILSTLKTDVTGLAIGIDQSGGVTAAWSQGTQTNPQIESATGSAATGRWHRPRQLARAGAGGTGLALAVNSAGDAVLAWQRQTGTAHRSGTLMVKYAETAAFRPAHHAWGKPVRLGRLETIASTPGVSVWVPAAPTLALDAAGDATVTWQSLRPDGQVLEWAHRPRSSGRWSVAADLAENAAAPVIASDAHGDETVAWTGELGRVYVITMSSGAKWSKPVPIPGATGAFLTWLSVGQTGNALLTWAGVHDKVYVSTRSGPAAGWTQPVQVGVGGFPQAALDASGEATILWPKATTSSRAGQVIDATTIPAL
jgi:hypothetical protein